MKSKLLLGVTILMIAAGSLVGCGGEAQDMKDELMPSPSASAPASASVKPSTSASPTASASATAPAPSASAASNAMGD